MPDGKNTAFPAFLYADSFKESANTDRKFVKHGIIPEAEKGVVAVSAYRSKLYAVLRYRIKFLIFLGSKKVQNRRLLNRGEFYSALRWYVVPRESSLIPANVAMVNATSLQFYVMHLRFVHFHW